VFSAQQQETDLDFRSNLLKIKSLGPDVLALAGQSDAIARIVTRGRRVSTGSAMRSTTIIAHRRLVVGA